MSWFLKSINLDLWDVIEDGPHIPSKLENGVMVPKPKHDIMALNAKLSNDFECRTEDTTLIVKLKI